jgi:hypothetical protein
MRLTRLEVCHLEMREESLHPILRVYPFCADPLREGVLGGKGDGFDAAIIVHWQPVIWKLDNRTGR